MIVYRYRDGAWFNSLLFAYITFGVVLSLSMASVASLSIMGILSFFSAFALLCHCFILAAYLAHECMHNTIFKKTQWNDALGSILCFFLGAAFYPYKRLKDKHLRHHSERCDVLSIDISQHFDRHPILKHLVSVFVRLGFPIVELYSPMLAIAAPFFMNELKVYRGRVLMMVIAYLGILSIFIIVSPFLTFVYLFALATCYAVLGFMDTFQHTYEVKLHLDFEKEKSLFSRQYEEKNTYSNLLFKRSPIFNLLVLNFCYHNVHHCKSGEPWYRLQTLHKKMYERGCMQEIDVSTQLIQFHRYRVARISALNRNTVDSKNIGAVGVSFLVGV